MTTGQLAADASDLVPNTVVGEYVVEKKIGEGGFGSVYKALHPLIGKQVAVKVLARHFSAQEDMVSRFIAEARAVNQIRSRNIIDIFSFGTLPDGRVYYVMEFLEGESLEDYLNRRGALPLGEVLQIVSPIARALDAAHAAGIAHRDIKPENIFLVRDEDNTFPKLLDFGIAKLLGGDNAMHKTQTGAPIGTPHYMSPEQSRGRDVDHRTDFYSFGIMLYRMLVGRVPYDGEDYLTILMKHISDPVPSVAAARSDLAGAADQVVSWLLQKDAAARPPNLRAAIDQLAPGQASRLSASQAKVTGAPSAALASTMASGMASGFNPDVVVPLDTIGLASGASQSRKGLWIVGALVIAAVGIAVAWSQMQKTSAPAETPASAAATQATTITTPTTAAAPAPDAPTPQPSPPPPVQPDAAVPAAAVTPQPAAVEVPTPDPAPAKKGRTDKSRAGDTKPTKTPEKQPAKPTVDSIEDPFAS